MQFSTFNSQLSILIACRNEINNLPNLLESIENQTFKPDEVIFVDDNSTDETYNFLINYSKKYNYIKVIKNSLFHLVTDIQKFVCYAVVFGN